MLLFNYEYDNQDKVNEEANVKKTKLENKQQRLAIKMEKCIINLDYKCFFKSCITEHHFRDKRLLLDNVLSDLVKRKLLHVGHANNAFFETGRLSAVNTYMKYIPTFDDKQRFQYDLLNRYGVYYDDYVKQFQCAPLLPSGCRLTSYGLEFLRQSHYSIILHNESRIFGTSAVLIFHKV